MKKIQNPMLLVLVAAIAVAIWQRQSAPPDLCYAIGSVTYRLAPNAAAPDYRVAVDNTAARPDIRVQLVDRVETADFALTDDTGSRGNACAGATSAKSIRVVPAGAAADLTIAVSTQTVGRADFSLYVHSAGVSLYDAAALFALVRRSPDSDRALDGAPGQVADIR